MGDMADYALDGLMDEDEAQLEELGHSIVFCQPPKIPIRCPACGKVIVVRDGPYGRFAGCSGFPKCKAFMCIPITSEPELSDDDLDKMGRL